MHSRCILTARLAIFRRRETIYPRVPQSVSVPGVLTPVAGYKKAAKNAKEQNYTLTLTYSPHINLDCERMLEVQKGVHVYGEPRSVFVHHTLKENMSGNSSQKRCQ